MAITQNPIIGASRQSAGGMVFSRSLDQNIIRAKPITYNDKNSLAQQVVRGRMSTVTGLAKADSKKALDTLYPTRPFKQTRFSRLIQQLMTAVTVIAGTVVVNFENLLTLGSGTLSNFFTSIEWSFNVGVISVLQNNVIPDVLTNTNYRLFVYIFNVTKNAGISEVSSVVLTDSKQISFTVPSNWLISDEYAIYTGYTNLLSGNSSLAYKTEVA